MSGEAMPTGRERPGEHWNARIIREDAEAKQMLADLREAAEIQHELAESGNPIFQAAAGRLNFDRKYKLPALSTSGEVKP